MIQDSLSGSSSEIMTLIFLNRTRIRMGSVFSSDCGLSPDDLARLKTETGFSNSSIRRLHARWKLLRKLLSQTENTAMLQLQTLNQPHSCEYSSKLIPIVWNNIMSRLQAVKQTNSKSNITQPNLREVRPNLVFVDWWVFLLFDSYDLLLVAHSTRKDRLA